MPATPVLVSQPFGDLGRGMGGQVVQHDMHGQPARYGGVDLLEEPSEVHTAPRASTQMPSGPSPLANTRRLHRPPSAAMSNGVSRRPNDSEMMSVALSGVMTVPLGKAMPLATGRTVPSGVISPVNPGR